MDGSTNHKTSNVLDHARSNLHKVAMIRLREEQAKLNNEPVTSYSTIARSLLSPPLDEAVKDRLSRKFQISFVIAKECLPFTKYPALHELEEHHDVDLGQAYKTRESASKFVHYIAESQRQDLHHSLSSHHFYSCLMDGSVDKGKIENELFVI